MLDRVNYGLGPEDDTPALPRGNPEKAAPGSPPLSKRAARRLIQRAFVLVGRDRHVRQHLREANVVTLWVVEDWKFAWTVELERGKVRYERRPAKQPDLRLTWKTAEDFFNQVENEAFTGQEFELAGKLELRKFSGPVCQTFCKILRKVMQYPFDDAGNPLA